MKTSVNYLCDACRAAKTFANDEEASKYYLSYRLIYSDAGKNDWKIAMERVHICPVCRPVWLSFSK